MVCPGGGFVRLVGDLIYQMNCPVARPVVHPNQGRFWAFRGSRWRGSLFFLALPLMGGSCWADTNAFSTSVDIGNPSPASVVSVTGSNYLVSAAGDIGGTTDQFHFQYEAQNGDFDISVQLQGLTWADPWAKAGLMARETLDPSARFTATLATPTMNGVFFLWRSGVGTTAIRAGSAPSNYPNTWLRLQRSGNLFTSYGSFDGQTWTALGSSSILMATNLFLGLATSSHATNLAATAQFINPSDTPTNAVVGQVDSPYEAPGPSSRKTCIAITEIMYKPAPRADGRNLEFVELYNSNPWFYDLSGHRLACADMNYTFPAGTIIPGGAYLAVAAKPADLQAVYGITNVLGPYTGSLKKSETLELINEWGAVLLSIPYTNVQPWPVAADGSGHSLMLANPTYGEADPRAWAISDAVGGSPGEMEAFHPSPLRNVVINEFLAHSEDAAVPQFIELYNHAGQPVDLSGCVLTDDLATNKFVVPAGVTAGPGGFVSFDQTQLGFTLNGAGGILYLIKPDGSRILDAVPFEGQADGVSFGRWPDGASEFYSLAARTPGTGNGAIRSGNVVINELMYDPISGNDDDQYIELYNQGTNAVNLGNWRFISGVSFTIPPGAALAPNGYLVVARNATNLFARYPNLNSGNTVGDYSGKLSHNGDRVALASPHTLNGATIYVVEDEVTYGTGGRWGQWSAGGGSSLELTDPRGNHRLAANWADSDESQKSSWINIENTGVLDNGQNYDSTIDYAQIGLLDVGECLVDNIEVLSSASTVNNVTNPDFEAGLLNWRLQGCHVRSSLEASGYQSGHSLHVRCSDRLWTGVNSCEISLKPNSMAAGQTATLRFKARWLHGWPEALLRLNGNWLEATGALPVPTNLGTPGAPNSRSVPNAGPAIYAVTHTPTLPAAGQATVVTARVHDPDGVTSLTLNYRLDPGTVYTSVPMRDDGTGGDAIAGDGIYSATIPGQFANRIVAFYVSAADGLAATTRFPALIDDNAPVRDCLVMFGDGNPGGSFGVYHLWITQSNATRWAGLSDLSNESHDCTMVNGRRVIYNSQARWSGSPYHQSFDTPAGSLCHYKWTFPDDDKFLGATSFNKIHQPGNGPGDDASLQREQTAQTFMRALGVPWLNRRYVAVYVNGNRRGLLMEDAQTPDGDVVKENFPNDPDGYLYKMQPWFEFAPYPNGASLPFNNYGWCTLLPYYTTGGVKKAARYRYNFLTRRTPDSASNFTNVYSLIDAANSWTTPNYVANVQAFANMENFMRVFAANHAAGNWDSFGTQNGQNLYGYYGTQGTKYSLIMWDYNIVLGNSGSWTPGQNLFTSSDNTVAQFYTTPAFRRMYLRALLELVNGPMNVTNVGPLVDAKYGAFVANGLSPENTSAMKSWIASARSSIASQIAVETTAPFAVSSTVVSNNLAVVTGTAPAGVKTVWFNGVEYPVTWLTSSSWRASVPLQAGTNQFNVVGVGINGQAIAGAVATISPFYAGTNASPVGQIVINEIMAQPALTGAEYVELFNNSTNLAFDLSGWQFHGLGYTFPAGSLIGANGYLVLAANRSAFAAAYGATNLVFDTFGGTLQANGETLSLIEPGTNAASAQVVAKVRYDLAAPWPVGAAGSGSSLQLVDPRQDNWRAGNWAVLTNAVTATPQWQYVTLTGSATKSTLLIGMTTSGSVYLDDMKLVAGSIAEAGPNLLTNGDFETPLSGPWTVSPNMSGSVISTDVMHTGQSSLHVIASSGGPTIGSAIWQNTATLVTNGTYTLSYWYLPSTDGSSLLIRLSGSSPGSGTVYSLQSYQPGGQLSLVTPGGANSVHASLPPFPPLWINELEPENLTGITNAAGVRSPWIELYNPSANVVDLEGLYLANDYANLTAWAFPAGVSIKPGEFKTIFADGLTNLSTAGELHTGFVLTPGGGAVALSRLYNGASQTLDYVSYPQLGPDHSYGSFPDGQSFDRQDFYYSTPGGTNNGTSAPLTVAINEWMAANSKTIINPLTHATDDWFELYNYGSNTVNLAGYYLGHSLTNLFEFQIPSGYTIPAHGFLLVWADKQSASGAPDLHANFHLSKSGTSIVISGPDGRIVDYVAFGAQASDVSMGRFPDGGASVFTLSAPTPGAANVAPAAALVISPLADWSVYAGQTIRFTALATDPDAPPQTPTYSLAAGAPTNAVIDPATGIFAWTPLPSQAPGTNSITVRATGDGANPLSGSRSFTVTVLTPPGLQAVGLTSQTLTLRWNAAPGKIYRLQYKDDLSAPAWNARGTDQVGVAGPLSLDVELSASPQRFYRILVVE